MAWHWFDWIVIGLYFVVMFFIGMFFAKRTKSTDDYFKAGGRVPALVTAMVFMLLLYHLFRLLLYLPLFTIIAGCLVWLH